MKKEFYLEFFKSVTGWTDDQSIHNYLESFGWDAQCAINAYFMDTSGKIRQPTTNDQLNHSPSSEDHASCNEKSTFDAFPQISRNSSQPPSVDQAHGCLSFSDHTDQLVASPDQTSPLFPHIQLYDREKRTLLRQINSNIIGKDVMIDTPCGQRKAVYADYTASGRFLLFIEQYILTHVLPFYGNTHSENNAFALQTTRFREAARKLIKQSVNASDDDVVIFTGPGSTSAINKLVEALQLRDERIRSRTVVFISTFEHHSNILPWTETGVEWIRVPNTPQGVLDEKFLEEKLAEYSRQESKSIICSFSAASNVTGILSAVDRISTLVHRYNGLIFWDYAAAAPYVHIDMNPSQEASKDAVFISTHKFVGGPGTPGLLIAKKKLFISDVPVIRGGGTINFVTRNEWEYVHDIETREEGGTPEIIGSIRAGLVMHLKNLVGHTHIEQREKELVQRFFREFANSDTLFLLGPTEPERLAIFSFLIYVPFLNKYLHHNFVCTLLNDLFGIQVRSGCSCAGPYVLDLLSLSDEKAHIYTKFFSEDPEHRTDDDNVQIPYNALMKPGFTRFNFSYFIDDDEVDYIIRAVKFVSIHGWRFLPLYTYNQSKGTWHVRQQVAKSPDEIATDLQSVDFFNQSTTSNPLAHIPTTESSFLNLVPLSPSTRENPFDTAYALSERMPDIVYDKLDCRVDVPLNVPEKYKNYVWFVTPTETMIKLLLEHENKQAGRASVAFLPRYRQNTEQS